MKKSAVIWIVLALGCIIFAIIVSGGRISAYIHIPSFVMVIVTSFFLSLCNYNPKEIGRSFKTAFTNGPSGETELNDALVFFKALQRYALISGVVGTLTGGIAMLANLEDASEIGPNISLALITLHYGIIFAVVICVPCITGLKRRLTK